MKKPPFKQVEKPEEDKVYLVTDRYAPLGVFVGRYKEGLFDVGIERYDCHDEQTYYEVSNDI